MGKTAYVARVKSVVKSAEAQQVARAVAGKLRSSCKQVVSRGEAAQTTELRLVLSGSAMLLLILFGGVVKSMVG